MGEDQGLIQRQLQQLLRLLLKNRLQPLLQQTLLHLHLLLLLLLHLLMILHLLRNPKHLQPALSPIYLASLTEKECEGLEETILEALYQKICRSNIA